MKTYLALTIFLPHAARALGIPAHISQVNVIVVAQRKADIAPLCEDRGMTMMTSRSVAKEARVNDRFNTIVALRDAGFAPADEVAVYVTAAGNESPNVLRLNLDGTSEIIAHTGYVQRKAVAYAGSSQS